MISRRWTAEEKIAIVLERLGGQSSLGEICREHQISKAQYYRWRDKFLEDGQKVLSNGGRADEVKVLRAMVAKLKKIIGRQAIAIELLKKPTSFFGGGVKRDEAPRAEHSW